MIIVYLSYFLHTHIIKRNSHGFKDYTVNDNETRLWQQLAKRYELRDEQLDQFKGYLDLLISWNKKMNLTTIIKPADIIRYHFEDSLKIMRAVSMNTVHSFADIGTGAGFPGIPIKILYPDKPLYLIEVNQKKISFLRAVITKLNLTNVEICSDDWRTFLRHSDYKIDLFCARASLQPEELIRMFKPTSPYKDATLVYWASATWKAVGMVWAHITREYPYTIGDKKRKLIVMNLPK